MYKIKLVYLIEDGLVGVPVHDILKNGAQEATVAMSLVLSAARHWPRDIGKQLFGTSII